MNISITGRHLEVTPSLKEYVQKKVDKVNYYFEHIINVHVILEVKKLLHCAEVTVMSDEKTFFCEVSSQDMYGSIDLLFDKIERQIRRNKERFSQRKRKAISSNFTPESEEGQAEEAVITKTKEVSPKPMTEHEAILQLALNNHSFEIFNEDLEGGRESIALKQDRDNYSLIQQVDNKWIKRDVKLVNEELSEVNKAEYMVNSLAISDAVESLAGDNSLRYLIFHDPEFDNLNIIYKRKDQSIGLLTSGGIL